MYLVLLVAAGAILGGVVVVAMGRGGQIASFRRDIPVPALRFRTPDEVALARLPLGLFGYQVQATGDALAAAAVLVDERDAEIAWLRREISRFGADPMVTGSVPTGSVPTGSVLASSSVTAAVAAVSDSDGDDDTLGGAVGDRAVGDGTVGDGVAGDEAAGDEAAGHLDAGLAAEPRWRQ